LPGGGARAHGSGCESPMPILRDFSRSAKWDSVAKDEGTERRNESKSRKQMLNVVFRQEESRNI